MRVRCRSSWVERKAIRRLLAFPPSLASFRLKGGKEGEEDERHGALDGGLKGRAVELLNAFTVPPCWEEEEGETEPR